MSVTYSILIVYMLTQCFKIDRYLIMEAKHCERIVGLVPPQINGFLVSVILAFVFKACREQYIWYKLLLQCYFFLCLK